MKFNFDSTIKFVNNNTKECIQCKQGEYINSEGNCVECENGFYNPASLENLSSLDASNRDNILQTEVQKRQKFQPEYENLSGITHIIIYNNGSIIELEQKVSAIENKIF